MCVRLNNLNLNLHSSLPQSFHQHIPQSSRWSQNSTSLNPSRQPVKIHRQTQRRLTHKLNSSPIIGTWILEIKSAQISLFKGLQAKMRTKPKLESVIY
jgi:hypothetical protein